MEPMRMTFREAHAHVCSARHGLLTDALNATNLPNVLYNTIIDFLLPSRFEFAKGCALDSLCNRYLYWAVPHTELIKKTNPGIWMQWVHLDVYDTPELLAVYWSDMQFNLGGSSRLDARGYYEELFAKYATSFAATLTDIPWFFDNPDIEMGCIGYNGSANADKIRAVVADPQISLP